MNIDCDWCICGKRALDVSIFYSFIDNIFLYYGMYVFFFFEK